MRRWRKMTWVVLLWCVAILVWAIAGGASASNKCSGDVYQDACNTGVGIGVAAIILIGFFGFVFFSLIWFMTRPRTRPCPRCGEDVKKGVMVCKSCTYDFATMGQPAVGVEPMR
jgi:hypothetical protein